MRFATTGTFIGVTTSQRAKVCFGKNRLSVGKNTSTTFIILKSATIIQYTIKGRFMSR